ncbi:MAG: manganese efflux pump [Paludibacter sp.]
MDLFSIIIIGIGLAMDCFAVSISKGICEQKFNFGNTFRMAFLFGIFQSFMPLIGFFAGKSFIHEMGSYDHWIAFGLLSIIGGKMLIEGLKPINPNCEINPNPFKWRTLFILAIATSIDALATGVVFVPYPTLIWYVISIIGGISFIFSFIGMFVGIHFGKRFHFNVEILGGIILIGIGLKILIEHLYF